MRILLVSLTKHCGAAMVRIDPFFHLKQHGYPCELKFEIHPTYEDLLWCDLLYIHRGHTNAHLEAVLNAKRLGKKVWSDVDDDSLHVPIDHEAYFHYQNPEIRKNIHRINELADVMTLSSKNMENFREINSKAVYIPCAYDERILSLRKEPSKIKKRVISWRGSPTHAKSLMEFADSIAEVENKHPGWTWHFIGMNPWFIIEKFKHSEVKVQPWIEPMLFFEYMQAIEPAIHLVVLTDNAFTKARSNLSYQDATMAGAITLAPDWDHFKKIGIQRYDQTNQKDFRRKLSGLMRWIEDGYDKHDEVEEAWQYIQTNLTFKKMNEVRIKILDKLFHSAKDAWGDLCVLH